MTTEVLPESIHAGEFSPSQDPGLVPAPLSDFDLEKFFQDFGKWPQETEADLQPKQIEPKDDRSVAERTAAHLLMIWGLSPEAVEGVSLHLRHQRFFNVMHSFTAEQLDERLKEVLGYANMREPVEMEALKAAFDEQVRVNIFPGADINPFPVSDIQEYLAKRGTSANVAPRQAEAHGAAMVQQDEKIFVKDNVRYRPLPLAAQLAQAPRQTLLNWIKNKTEFAGRPLQTYYLAPVDRFFVSEESIQRMANRFIKWPSQEPAGPVTIGDTNDLSGFLGTSEAARMIRVSPRTMWLWASQGKAPSDKPLDIIKCTTSDRFYIRERDIRELKKLIPRGGLQRGRRPQPTPTP